MVALTPNSSSEHKNVRSWTEFYWYVGGHGFYFMSQGIQAVMFPYLVTFYLQMPAHMVGIGQMFAMLPMFGLVLFGGMSADRAELRMHLIRLQCIATLPMLVLTAFLIEKQSLTFTWLVSCVTAVGCAGAFIMPARDSLLSRVAHRTPHGDLQKAVTASTGSQFGSQFIGMSFCILCLHFKVDVAIIMLVAVLAYLISAFCGTYVKSAPPEISNATSNALRDQKEPMVRTMANQIHEGLLEVLEFTAHVSGHSHDVLRRDSLHGRLYSTSSTARKRRVRRNREGLHVYFDVVYGGH